MKRITIIIFLSLITMVGVIIQSCVSTKITNKSGTDLWGENCQRCHSTPPISAFTNVQWGIINTHMRSRAMLTEIEYKKILGFMTGE